MSLPKPPARRPSPSNPANPPLEPAAPGLQGAFQGLGDPPVPSTSLPEGDQALLASAGPRDLLDLANRPSAAVSLQEAHAAGLVASEASTPPHMTGANHFADWLSKQSKDRMPRTPSGEPDQAMGHLLRQAFLDGFAHRPLQPHPAVGGAQRTLTLTLDTCGNPDLGQDPTRSLLGIPAEVVEVRTAQEASAAVQAFVARHQLGAGNCRTFTVTDGDRAIAQVSYNGRVWDTVHPNREIPPEISLLDPPLHHVPLKTSEGRRNYTAALHTDGTYSLTKDRNDTGDGTPVRTLPGVFRSWPEVVAAATRDDLARCELTRALETFLTTQEGRAHPWCQAGGVSIRRLPSPVEGQDWGLFLRAPYTNDLSVYGTNAWQPVEGLPFKGEGTWSLVARDLPTYGRDEKEAKLAELALNQKAFAVLAPRIRSAVEVVLASTSVEAVELRLGWDPHAGRQVLRFADEQLLTQPTPYLLDLRLAMRFKVQEGVAEPEDVERLRLAESELTRRPDSPSEHPGQDQLVDYLRSARQRSATGFVSEGILFQVFLGGPQAARNRPAQSILEARSGSDAWSRTVSPKTPAFEAYHEDLLEQEHRVAEAAFWGVLHTLKRTHGLESIGRSMEGFNYRLPAPSAKTPTR